MKPAVIQKPAAEGTYAIGRKSPISRLTFHHIAGDAPAAIARFQTAGEQVSAHYVIGSDGTIYQCVGTANTAYCDGNADSNARTISIEHAGGTASVPYTDAMYAASAKLVRYLIATYGITDFQRHRDVIDKTVYPGGTKCCGELDVERIVNAAKGGAMADITTEDDVRRSILAVTGNTMPKDQYEKEVRYWTGRSDEEFSKYLYALGDYFILAKIKEASDLKGQLSKLSASVLADKIKRVQAIINE